MSENSLLKDATKTIPMGNFFDVKVGDTITRLLHGIKMKLTVASVDERIIHTTGGWMFDRSTGFEHDPDIGMGVEFGITCSQLIKE